MTLGKRVIATRAQMVVAKMRPHNAEIGFGARLKTRIARAISKRFFDGATAVHAENFSRVCECEPLSNERVEGDLVFPQTQCIRDGSRGIRPRGCHFIECAQRLHGNVIAKQL